MNTNQTSIAAEPSRLYAHVVLDRSGSMVSCASDAVGGYNAYVAKLPDTARVSLTLFDSGGVDLIRDSVEPAAASLNTEEYVPRASTPLYDAIGRTIAEVEKRSVGFDRVALVILTDGFENASREFTSDAILKLLTRKQEKDGWLVIYLGANQDAGAVGQQFGTVADSSLSVDSARLREALDLSGLAAKAYASSADRQSGRRDAAFSREARRRAKPGSH